MVKGTVEYRKEHYTVVSGDPQSYYKTGAQSFFGYAPVNAGGHDRNTKAIYTDLAANPIKAWKVDLALFPGSNSVAAFVANKWRGERALEGVLKLHYRRPPRITAFPEKVEAVETNKVGMTLTVAGPKKVAPKNPLALSWLPEKVVPGKNRIELLNTATSPRFGTEPKIRPSNSGGENGSENFE